MKRKVGIGALVVVVIGLVALNLSMRPDPEPEYIPDDEPLPERSYSPVLRDGLDDPDEEVEEDAPADPEAEPEARADDEETDEEVDGCDHPLIPSRAGQWRLYRWSMTTQDLVAQLRIRALRTVALRSGEREVVWQIRTEPQAEGEQPARFTMRTRCRPGDDGEDPWFGILERAIDYRETRRTPRWRWPAELARGTTFCGTVTFDASRSEAQRPDGVEGDHMVTVTRNHVVAEQEEIEVPAGTFNAWRVAYEERQAYGSHSETGPGTIWIAPDVGLVRMSAENSRGDGQTLELLRLGGDE